MRSWMEQEIDLCEVQVRWNQDQDLEKVTVIVTGECHEAVALP